MAVTWFSLLALGFFLGMRHATDPDHVVAVTTIVSRERRLGAAALVGAVWGVGHTITILVVGGSIVLFGLVIPPRVGLTMEFSVALMLIVLGLLNLVSLTRWAVGDRRIAHSHAHTHGDHLHQHVHTHDHGHTHPALPDDALPAPLGHLLRRLPLHQLVRPLLVGIVHGLAGSAAVALLVLATIPDARWAVAYLLVFGLGTIAGMVLITLANALPFAYTAQRFGQANRLLGVACGLLSMGFGLFLAYHLAAVDGLFSSHPVWTPG